LIVYAQRFIFDVQTFDVLNLTSNFRRNERRRSDVDQSTFKFRRFERLKLSCQTFIVLPHCNTLWHYLLVAEHHHHMKRPCSQFKYSTLPVFCFYVCLFLFPVFFLFCLFLLSFSVSVFTSLCFFSFSVSVFRAFLLSVFDFCFLCFLFLQLFVSSHFLFSVFTSLCFFSLSVSVSRVFGFLFCLFSIFLSLNLKIRFFCFLHLFVSSLFLFLFLHLFVSSIFLFLFPKFLFSFLYVFYFSVSQFKNYFFLFLYLFVSSIFLFLFPGFLLSVFVFCFFVICLCFLFFFYLSMFSVFTSVFL
jgi:hypothetical protein